MVLAGFNELLDGVPGNGGNVLTFWYPSRADMGA